MEKSLDEMLSLVIKYCGTFNKCLLPAPVKMKGSTTSLTKFTMLSNYDNPDLSIFFYLFELL